MTRGGEQLVDSKFLAHLPQSKIVELLSIVSDDQVWDSKLVDDVSPDEVHAFHLYDHGERFFLYPLDEIIDRQNGEFGLCPSSGK